ncbi:MAG: substrate-binding domain-containing protein [bacterium]
MRIIKVKSKVWLEDNGKYIFGDGRAVLLRGIGETGSIKTAAEQLSISYRRAWEYVKKLEERLGVPLVEPQIGGRGGGGSQLTEKAKIFLKNYEKARKDINKYVDKRFSKFILSSFFIGLLSCCFLTPSYADKKMSTGKKEILRMATTTSTENSGLLDVLLPPFEKKFNIRVDVIPVGTGKALKLGERGDVDLVFVHDREAEDKFVNTGFGINRRDVMYNDFIIVGPAGDPAGVKGMKDPVLALNKIEQKQYPFVSRGDDSGTHKKELQLWNEAEVKPEGKWYMEAGQGMEEVLQIANEKMGYTLTDRGTFLAYKKKLKLVVLVEGDKRLYNPYGIIAVNPAKHPHVNYIGSMTFIGWVTSPEGQRIIAGYKVDNSPLFYPQAITIFHR